MAAELIVANLRGGVAEREAAYAQLLRREEEHNANSAPAATAPATTATREEELQALTLSALRARALMEEHTEQDVEAATDDTEDPKAALVQLLLSRAPESLATIAVACASPLCDVLCKNVSEVNVTEWHRAAQVLTALSGADPAHIGAECVKPDQCNYFAVWTAPDNALGVSESCNIIRVATLFIAASLTNSWQP